jgi:ELWxxDGT repeat protein
MYKQNEVLFDGPDLLAPGEQTLWVTNGTAAGTSEFPQISGAENGGLNPSYLTPYDGEVLFEGIDSSSEFGLWVTNGTGAGTSEIGGIGSTGISGANPDGLQPEYFQVYGSEVLFRGITGLAGDAIGSLWVTNGTAAGTSEIGGAANTGISGISSGGMLPGDPEFTVFNGKVLFSARDAANNQGLWITNGTAAGTSELAPISGAMTVGSPGSDVMGAASPADGPDFVVLGNEVLFRGNDTQDTPGSLWVTNGTAAGTSEIGGEGNKGIAEAPAGFSGTINGAPRSELAAGMQPADLITFNGKAMFAAYDNQLDTAGYYIPSEGLWVSDGTAGGTTEIGGLGSTGITGAFQYVASLGVANGGGIFDSGNVADPDFTVYNNEVLFIGADASNDYAGYVGLWVTNGTAAGTSEIGGLGNTGISGFSGFNGADSSLSPDFTVLNGEVLFSSGGDLWVTNGTAQGTKNLGKETGNTYAPLGADFTIVDKVVPPTENFNGNDTSDVLFRDNAPGGDTGYYRISNGANAGWSDIGSTSTAYSVVGAGEFVGNGTADVLFRDNTSGGDTGYYEIVNGTLNGWHDIGSSSTAYSVVGTGDFTGNGFDDILFRDNATGDTGFYSMVNGAYTGWRDIGASSTAYSVVGAGDFMGTGTDDILYRDNTTGDTGFYQIVNGANVGWHDFGATSTAYSVVGVGDFTGSGTDDVLFRDNTTGDTGFYQIVNGVNTGWHDLGGSSTAYSVVGTGDYNGNNTSDILFRDTASGDVGFYSMVNGVNAGWHDIGASSTAYQVVG